MAFLEWARAVVQMDEDERQQHEQQEDDDDDEMPPLEPLLVHASDGSSSSRIDPPNNVPLSNTSQPGTENTDDQPPPFDPVEDAVQGSISLNQPAAASVLPEATIFPRQRSGEQEFTTDGEVA